MKRIFKVKKFFEKQSKFAETKPLSKSAPKNYLGFIVTANPLIGLVGLAALPLLAVLGEKFWDTARSVSEAADDLEVKFKDADEAIGFLWESDEDKLYRSNMENFKEFRENVKNIKNTYLTIVNKNKSNEERLSALGSIEKLVYDFSRKSRSISEILNEAKGGLVKGVELVEDFILSPEKNKFRKVQDAITRLDKELSKADLELDKIKKELEKNIKNQQSAQIAQRTPEKDEILTDFSVEEFEPVQPMPALKPLPRQQKSAPQIIDTDSELEEFADISFI